MTNNLEQLEAAVNNLTRQGKMLDSIDQYYSDNCIFVESDGSSRKTKADQLAHLTGFFGTLKSFDGATLHGAATGKDYATSEWTFNMTAGDGAKIEWNEVLVRSWKDGKVVSEAYYQK